MQLFFWKGKQLRTVWRIEKEGKSSRLVGTAHFSPYSFKKSLVKLIQNCETVLFEGPLDQESMAKVVRYGQKEDDTRSLYEALDPAVVKEINRQLSALQDPTTKSGSYLELISPGTSDFLEAHTQGVRPWMAFFIIWSAFLDWKHSMDVEAYHIAQELGKKIEYLETIEDQLAALDGIPFDNIVNYLNHIELWSGHKELFLKAFLEGDLEKFSTMTGQFPTRCESIITKRDPIFFRRIRSFLEEGKTTAFVGVAHIPGIRKLFLDEGYQVIQEQP
jgi:uncharacterized protein YbaP (TraB family)